jgi:hypothetical protein
MDYGHLANFAMPGSGPVPAVDAADLRIAWEWMQKMKARLAKAEHRQDPAHPGRASSYDAASLGLSSDTGYSPGADMGAIWYRIAMLGVLERMSTAGALLPKKITVPNIDYRKPSDAVFKALAIVRVMGPSLGGPPIQGLPIDTEELGKLIQRETDPSLRSG